MSFSQMHPLTQFLFFLSAACSALFSREPLFLLVSFVLAFALRCIQIKSIRIFKEMFLFGLLFLATAGAVVLTSHNGKTALFFINENAVTKQSLVFAACTGMKVLDVSCWLVCMAYIMSGEKIVYLLSGVFPRLSVFVSGMMRFLPAIKKQYINIYHIQRCIYSGRKTLRKKVAVVLKSLSALLTWIIESSADSADSMYSRGYGLWGRSSMSIYRFRYADFAIIALSVYALFFTAAAKYFRVSEIKFYPVISLPKSPVANIIIFILWTALMLIPVITEICEEYKWKLLRSKI